MRVEQLPLCGGGTLAVYLREASARMPNALRRPMVIVVPAGDTNTSAPGRATLWRCSLQRQGITPPS